MSRPLIGKTVLVTRPAGQTSQIAEELRNLGASVIVAPAAKIEPLPDTSILDEALAHIEGFDWIVLTSVNGVETMFERLDALGLRRPSTVPFAVIGSATAKALRRYKIQPSAMPQEFVSDRIAHELGDVNGKRILLARADLARQELADELERKGAIVTCLTLYRLTPALEEPPAGLGGRPEGPDYITLTSAAIARNTIAYLRGSRLHGWLEGATICCIGPITAEAVREEGLAPHLVAKEYTIEGLIAALVEHAQKSSRELQEVVS